MTMGCTVRQVEGVTILDLSGRLSLGEVLAFRPGRDLPLNEVVRELTNDGHMKILLNLADVKYVDSSGVGQLVGTLTSARSQGVELKMFNPAKPVLDLLKIRPIQFCMFLKALVGAEEMKKMMVKGIAFASREN